MSLEEYIENFSLAEDPLLTELDRVTNLRVVQPKMVSGRVQGAFLKLVVEMLRPRTVLEIGTFTGYSALAMASGLASKQAWSDSQGAELHTIEVDDELEDLAQSFFDRSPHGGKIHLHIGSALDVAPKLFRELRAARDFDGFDLVFVDGDKREYPDYYRMLMGDRNPEDRMNVGSTDGETAREPMMRSGSIILVDNVLWYGKVAEDNTPDAQQANDESAEELSPEMSKKSGKTDRHTAGIMELNRIVAADPRVENVILPLRDGINIIRVK